MKKIIVGMLALVSVLSAGCSLTVEKARANTPKDAQLCNKDTDCGRFSVCTFQDVDQLATCKYTGVDREQSSL